jgi:hypothetical protein
VHFDNLYFFGGDQAEKFGSPKYSLTVKTQMNPNRFYIDACLYLKEITNVHYIVKTVHYLQGCTDTVQS